MASRAGAKKKMRKKKRKARSNLPAGQWKPVEFDSSVLLRDKNAFEGLISFDVLDGDAVQVDTPESRRVAKSARSKRGTKQEVFEPKTHPLDQQETSEGAPKQPVKQRKRKRKRSQAIESRAPDPNIPNPNPEQASGDTPRPAKKRKAKSQDESARQATATASIQIPPVGSTGWDKYGLHPLIVHGLTQLGFTKPTPIQDQCLHAAVSLWKDVVGAAETGSGKTLAFGLPIVQRFLEHVRSHEDKLQDKQRKKAAKKGRRKNRGTDADGDDVMDLTSGQEEKSDTVFSFDSTAGSGPLFALVLTPTRELALQVAEHIQDVSRFTPLTVTVVVGGMAAAKQKRMLGRRPRVVVATPGRLWELLSMGEPHLSDLQSLRCLVLDEADRMVAHGRFPELQLILDYVQQQGGLPPQSRSVIASEDPDFRAALMAQQAQDTVDEPAKDDLPPSPTAEELEAFAVPSFMLDGMDEGTLEELGVTPEAHQGPGQDDQKDDPEEDPPQHTTRQPPKQHVKQRRFRRQTFLFSATLALQADERREESRSTHLSSRRVGNRKGDQQNMLTVLRDRIQFHGPPHVVDLSSSNKTAAALEESVIECLETEKDVYLAYVLSVVGGKTIVFCNSISSVRRLVGILTQLKLPVSGIHAQQQQRQRLKSLDRFRSRPNGVIVCTDVAARGLDVRNIEYVVHYQVPRSTEIYIHRSGRTARAGAKGLSVLLVDENSQRNYLRICNAVNGGQRFEKFLVDESFLPQIKDRVNLAAKVDTELHKRQKKKSSNDWFRKAAEAMDIVLDEDLLQEEDPVVQKTGKKRRRRKSGTDPVVYKLQQQLAAELAKPLVSKGVSRNYITVNTTIAAPSSSGSIDFRKMKR